MKSAYRPILTALLIPASVSLAACQNSVSLGEGVDAAYAGPCAHGVFTTFAEAQNEPNSMAIGAEYVFWFNQGKGSGDPTYPTQEMRAPKGGGPAAALLTGGPTPPGVDPVSVLGVPVFDDQNLSWIQGNYSTLDGTLESETLLTMSQAGGAPVTVATTTEGFPDLVAADADGFYFTSYTPDTGHASVLSMPRAGGPLAVLATLTTDLGTTPGAGYIGRLLTDAGHLYFRHEGNLMALPKAGGAPVILAANADAMVQDDEHIYWSADAAIHAIAKSGGAPTTIAPAPSAYDEVGVLQTSSIFSDGVCFYSAAYPEHVLMAVPKSGGELSAIAAVASSSVGNWVADATGVYASDPNGSVLELGR
jgi:hypothetical protein